MNLTHPLTLSRTCEALAEAEVYALHTPGKHDLVDLACEGEGKERKKEKMRNEEARAAGLKTI